jgi:hypothetical protein
MDVVDFHNLVISSLKGHLDRSGVVIYNSTSAIRPGTFYFLGYNPGGDANSDRLETIRQHLNNLEVRSAEYSALEDECWLRGEFKSRIQKRALWLFTQLGCDPRHIVSTNLIFFRAASSDKINHLKDAEICWPVHRAILDRVELPQDLLTVG